MDTCRDIHAGREETEIRCIFKHIYARGKTRNATDGVRFYLCSRTIPIICVRKWISYGEAVGRRGGCVDMMGNTVVNLLG